MIDFTNCRILLGRAYNGANGSKIAVEYNGAAYIAARCDLIIRPAFLIASAVS